MQIELVNKRVTHKVFGEGIVVKYDDSYIEVDFPVGNKTFIFPDTFEKYLTLVDRKAAAVVGKLVQERVKEREEEEQEARRLQILENEERQRRLRRRRLLKARRTRKIHSRLQSVFWCDPEELDNIFTDWQIFTGVIKSGLKKGQPRRLARMDQNSACLLTLRSQEVSEKERRIIGAFMVSENFDVRKTDDGFIPAHSEYRLKLSKQESDKMLFWNYYINKRYPHRMTWNTGRHRYFDNKWMAKILRDIISLREDPKEKEQVQKFFDYFCDINQINKEKLPKASGALVRK